MPPTRRSTGPHYPLTPEDVSNDLSPSTENEEKGVSSSVHSKKLLSRSSIETQPLSIDQIYSTSKKNAKLNNWHNNPYAAGLVEVTWKDEMNRRSGAEDEDDNANGPNRPCCSDVGDSDMDPTCGCLAFTGYICGNKWINAGRVGNMVILKESNVMVEVSSSDIDGGSEDNNLSNDDEETAVMTRKVYKRRIDLVVGPYWAMMVFVTYPLILGVSLWTALSAVFVEDYNVYLCILWSALTFGLCFALFSVACSDPGILSKHRQLPKKGNWRYNDRAQSFIPRGAMYDPDCAVVVEEFDHTCPWTGTAIGKKNMPAFQAFIGLLFTCLIMDIILLTTLRVA